MPSANAWIICEKSGSWAAALRIALSRRSATTTPALRFSEVRSLVELNTELNERAASLVFIEVQPDNLTAVLNMLTKRRGRNTEFVALLGDNIEQRALVSDTLWEAGAVESIDSPRHIRAAITLAELRAISLANRAESAENLESIAERAWAALPWQDG